LTLKLLGCLSGPGFTDITVQNQCPLDQSDHLELAYDPVAMADMLNALDPSTPCPCPACRCCPSPVRSDPFRPSDGQVKRSAAEAGLRRARQSRYATP
jgi:hypothetical protein